MGPFLGLSKNKRCDITSRASAAEANREISLMTSSGSKLSAGRVAGESVSFDEIVRLDMLIVRGPCHASRSAQHLQVLGAGPGLDG